MCLDRAIQAWSTYKGPHPKEKWLFLSKVTNCQKLLSCQIWGIILKLLIRDNLETPKIMQASAIALGCPQEPMAHLYC